MAEVLGAHYVYAVRLTLRFLILAAWLTAGCGANGSTPPGSSSPNPRSSSGGSLQMAGVARAPPRAAHGDLQALRAGNDVFAARLLAGLAGGPGNVALSPVSVSETMSMSYAGARGRTAGQMARALGFRLSPPRLFRAFNVELRALGGLSGAGVVLRVANALYGQRGASFRPAFLTTLARYFGAGVRTVDFRSPESARAEINSWVSGQTAGKIPQLLAQDDVDPTTQLMLLNALYLKAKWAHPFTHDSTFPAPFGLPGHRRQVPTMHQTAIFPYGSAPGYRALELPYQGGRLALDILLPKGQSLQALLRQMTKAGAIPLLRSLAPHRVRLALPRVRGRTMVQLAGALAGLGMPLAFRPGRADFSGIAGAPANLFIARVVHEVYLNVDEAGTEAAGATGVTIEPTALAPRPAMPFVVDRPFAVVLRDRGSDAILFSGAITQP